MIKTIATKDGSINVQMTAQEISARQESEDAYMAALPENNILEQITDLKSQITKDRLVDAMCTDDGMKWLKQINDQITALREKI